MTGRKKIIIVLTALVGFLSIVGYNYGRELYYRLNGFSLGKKKLILYEQNRSGFTLKSGDEYKLINSAIKQDYTIFFSGKLVELDTLIIGKGIKKYLSSFLVLTHDSIFISRIATDKKTKSYKHNVNLQENLIISIHRKINTTFVSLISEKDTFKITSDFAGMNNPFVKSIGTRIDVDKFEFTCKDYISDVYIFGDSYVNCGTPRRWPYYIYRDGFQFLCDGLPGGTSIDSYDYLHSALSIHQPKFLIWCLGMNDGNDDEFGASVSWKDHLKMVMELCEKNNITLILATVPSVPTRDNTKKNEFVRNSGYRFIDFDKAVSDGKGIWKQGMLSDDGVHPTEIGGKALAERFLVDFPEIKDYTK